MQVRRDPGAKRVHPSRQNRSGLWLFRGPSCQRLPKDLRKKSNQQVQLYISTTCSHLHGRLPKRNNQTTTTPHLLGPPRGPLWGPKVTPIRSALWSGASLQWPGSSTRPLGHGLVASPFDSPLRGKHPWSVGCFLFSNFLLGKGSTLKSTNEKRMPCFSYGHWASEEIKEPPEIHVQLVPCGRTRQAFLSAGSCLGWQWFLTQVGGKFPFPGAL